MADAILVLNAGSSSIKFSTYAIAEQEFDLLLRGQIEGLATRPHFVATNSASEVVDEHRWADGKSLQAEEAVRFLVDWCERRQSSRRMTAAGHRVVHGGVKFSEPALVDDAVFAELEKLVPLAPLHQPHNLAAIRILRQMAPDIPQVACFDTAFHRTQPALAQTFALPRRYTDEGILRYGFHGLSYEFIARKLRQLDPRAAAGRAVVAHLGNGASMCAMRDGKSIATTMGFTTVDGLPMGTRCGSLDPGVLLYLINAQRMNADELETLLYHQSGLLGVSGISSDVRTLLASSDPRAAEALDLFVYRMGRELGSLAAALGGIDALVFTGGVGENAVPIRERVCRGATWLGLKLDEDANAKGGPRISHPESSVSVWVVGANEELMIALHTKRLLDGLAGDSEPN